MSVTRLVEGRNARDGAMVASASTPAGVLAEYARLEGREAIAGQVVAYCTAVPDCALDVCGPHGMRATAVRRGTIAAL